MYEAKTEWRTRREKTGLSLRRLADLSGLNRGTISRIERGLPATATQAQALLAILENPDVTAVIGREPEA